MVPELFNMRFKHSPYVPFDPSVQPLYSNYVTHAMMGGLQPFCIHRLARRGVVLASQLLHTRRSESDADGVDKGP